MYKHAYDEKTNVYIKIFRNLVWWWTGERICVRREKYEIGDFVIQDGLI